MVLKQSDDPKFPLYGELPSPAVAGGHMGGPGAPPMGMLPPGGPFHPGLSFLPPLGMPGGAGGPGMWAGGGMAPYGGPPGMPGPPTSALAERGLCWRASRTAMACGPCDARGGCRSPAAHAPCTRSNQPSLILPPHLHRLHPLAPGDGLTSMNLMLTEDQAAVLLDQGSRPMLEVEQVGAPRPHRAGATAAAALAARQAAWPTLRYGPPKPAQPSRLHASSHRHPLTTTHPLPPPTARRCRAAARGWRWQTARAGPLAAS